MRNRQFFALDILLLCALPALALSIRYESLQWDASLTRAALVYSILALPLRITIAYRFGLYRCLWRFASLSELERMLSAGLLAGAATILLGGLGITLTGLAPQRLPYSALLLDAFFALSALAGPRLLARFLSIRSRRSSSDRRAIIAGAGAAGQLIQREIRLNERLQLQIVAFVDDDPLKQKQLLGGVQVLGTVDELPAIIRALGADEVIIAMPGARGSVVRKVVKAASDVGIMARTMPGMEDLISGRVRVNTLRHVEIHDLLRREPIVTDLHAVRELATDRMVLVTGAGGSIGSEICRQIAALGPSTLVALDHSENQVFEIHSELRSKFPHLAILPVIADIRDAARLHGIIGRLRPHAIFHAAAHKHVPMMEANIVEAITNNILGTRNLVDAALDAETRHLVNISTDKAVRPTSIMGATKRVGEKIVLNAAIAEQRHYISVRFGNVLGSRGSVIPTFLRQIAAGGPITVTHPEMRRYFMTIPEAVQLVLQAGALGAGGELFVLDMGEPVKVVDLARDLIRLSGLEEGSDIEIAFTGVRPGEKLYEEVFFGGEDIRATNHDKVLRAVGDVFDPALSEQVESLVRNAITHKTSDADLRELLRTIVPEFARQDARTDPRSTPLRATPPVVAVPRRSSIPL